MSARVTGRAKTCNRGARLWHAAAAAWLSGADPETNLKIYAAVNSKGGAGKSSMLIAFASALHQQGKNVRILDLDSQETLSGLVESGITDWSRSPPMNF